MKTIKLDPAMSHLQIDRWAVTNNIKIVRFFPGRPASESKSRPPRSHVVIGVDAK